MSSNLVNHDRLRTLQLAPKPLISSFTLEENLSFIRIMTTKQQINREVRAKKGEDAGGLKSNRLTTEPRTKGNSSDRVSIDFCGGRKRYLFIFIKCGVLYFDIIIV